MGVTCLGKFNVGLFVMRKSEEIDGSLLTVAIESQAGRTVNMEGGLNVDRFGYKSRL